MENSEKAFKLLQEGVKLQFAEKLEEAYEKYEASAIMGNSTAMLAIACLYLHTDPPFRGIKLTMEEMIQAVIAGSLPEPIKPDAKTALTWLMKAIDLKNGDASGMLGSMLYEGEYVPQDKTAGIKYLQLGVEYGSKKAVKVLKEYQESERQLSDAEYLEYLEKFRITADKQDDECIKLYQLLRNGTPEQLYRLGYTLLAGKSTGNLYYASCQVPLTAEGMPYMPVSPKPSPGGRWVRVDWQAFPTNQPMLAIASNPLYLHRFQKMNQEGKLQSMHHMKIAGTATYRSPAFGELEEEKQALLLIPDSSAELDMECYSQIVMKYDLRRSAYDDDPAFFVDSAEGMPGEYSLEMASIIDNRVDVLFRYHVKNILFCNMINGSDIEKQFPPELLSLNPAE